MNKNGRAMDDDDDLLDVATASAPFALQPIALLDIIPLCDFSPCSSAASASGRIRLCWVSSASSTLQGRSKIEKLACYFRPVNTGIGQYWTMDACAEVHVHIHNRFPAVRPSHRIASSLLAVYCVRPLALFPRLLQVACLLAGSIHSSLFQKVQSDPSKQAQVSPTVATTVSQRREL